MKAPSTSLGRWRMATSVATAAVFLLTATPQALAHHAARAQGASHYGGTLVENYGLATSCLDPQKTTQGPFTPMFDTLVTQDNRGRIRPGLATSWKAGNGGKSITFTLRQGVKFSNGDPFTAASVKASFDRTVNPATKSPVAASYLSHIASTQVVSKYKVRLNFAAPYRPIFSDLAIFWTGVVDAKAMNAEGDASCSKPIGTGPYKLQSTGTAFDTITMVPNPYHTWAPAWYHNHGKPYIAKLVFKAVTDPATAASELLTGDIDLTDVDASQLDRVSGNAKIKLYKSISPGNYYVEFNLTRPPFNSLAARKALSEALNRSAVGQAAEGKTAFPVYGPWPKTIGFYDKTIQKYAPGYKPSAAQSYLSAHGINNLTIFTVGIPPYSTASEFVQGELAQVGVNAKINAVTYQEFPSGSKLNWDIAVIGTGGTDPDQIMSLFFHSGAPFSWFPKSATLDSLADKGRETLNTKKAAQYYIQLQRFIVKNVWIDPLFGLYTFTAARSRVHGWHTDELGAPLIQDLYVK